MSFFARVFSFSAGSTAYGAAAGLTSPDITIPFVPDNVQFYLEPGTSGAFVSPDVGQLRIGSAGVTANELELYAVGNVPIQVRSRQQKWWLRNNGGAGAVRIVASTDT